MTEDEARAWLVERLNVSRETLAKLAAYADMVAAEQVRQNLVSAATLSHFWARHIVDSAQLLDHARAHPAAAAGPWLDIGSGAGLPGIVLATMNPAPIMLVEPRPLRAAFLDRVIAALGLRHATVIAAPLARVPVRYCAVVTARAVAPLPKLIAMAQPFTDLSTIWLLPKGRNGRSELAMLPRPWQDAFTAQPSVTDPDSVILVGTKVGKAGGKR